GSLPPRRHCGRLQYGLCRSAGAQGDPMTHVVTDNCINCKHTDCVEVCPVDCFHAGPNFLVIDPDECIDCTLCVEECAVCASFPELDVPAGQEIFMAIKGSWPGRRRWDGAPMDWRSARSISRLTACLKPALVHHTGANTMNDAAQPLT